MAVNNYLDNSELAERIFIANGNVFKTSFVHKFGAVNAMSQNNYGTIWDVDDTLYPWTSLDAGPLVLDVVPANTADIEKSVTIEGLNENWEFVREVVTTDSSITPRGTSVNQFRRILDAIFKSKNITPNIMIESNSLIHLFSHVSSSDLSTIMPGSYASQFENDSNIQFIELNTPVVTHSVGSVFIKDKGPSPIKDSFIKFLKNFDK